MTLEETKRIEQIKKEITKLEKKTGKKLYCINVERVRYGLECIPDPSAYDILIKDD